MGRGRLCRFVLLLCLALFCGGSPAIAAGPRWVAGSPWWNAGQPMRWYTGKVIYATDPGPLSSFVDHDAAVALVDAAASTWNIPSSYESFSNGGVLAEDVNGGDVYLGANGPIWPADVDSGNYLNLQVAVVFDADGTLTDMLLGEGASDPRNCRTGAVTESVDLFIQPGQIAHAVMLLNGRCSGPAPEQQLQLRYQLTRAFGRVLGLGWSQTNDNVFTGAPAPTFVQQMHWPIMHPIDIICGPYTYQCLPAPFTLRDDDVASVDLLYANGSALKTAAGLTGFLRFPDGRGATGINLAIRRAYPFGTYGVDPYEDVSAVTGYIFKGDNGNPVTGAVNGNAAWNGFSDLNYAGFWSAIGIPIVNDFGFMYMFVEPQRVNPLYVGEHSVGPYDLGAVDPPAGLPPSTEVYFVGQGGTAFAGVISSTAPIPGCTVPADGQETAPGTVASTGIWAGRLCSYGQNSWNSFAVHSGRSATVEVSALDENGSSSSNKAMPVVGLWHGTDPAGLAPTLDAAPAALNGRLNGMTQLRVSFSATEQVRLGLSDQRGEGRPDFGYAARVLYADTVEPAQLPSTGGAIRILGLGFQPGNTVTVGGVRANVTRVTNNEIDAIVPPIALPASGADVVVTDLRTAGSTTITGGLFGSSGAINQLRVVRAPVGNVPVGVAAPFALQLSDSAGNPIANSAITVSFLAGAGSFAGCGAPVCTFTTDGGGLAQGPVVASAAGPVILEALAPGNLSASAQFIAVAPTLVIAPRRQVEYVAADTNAPLLPTVGLLNSGLPAAGEAVTWMSSSASVQLLAGSSVSDATGTAPIAAVAVVHAGQQVNLKACSWAEAGAALCASVPLIGVAVPDLRISAVSGAAQIVGVGTPLLPVNLRVTDAAGHGVAGATVAIHQTFVPLQPPCPKTGRCPTQPASAATVTSVISDDDGLFTIAPLQTDGAAGTTRIVAATGTAGYFAFNLMKQP